MSAQLPLIINQDLRQNRYLGIAINPFWAQKSKIGGANRRYNFDSYPALGVEALITSYRQFDGNYALALSLGVNATPSAFEYAIDKNDFNPPTQANIIDDGRFTADIYFQAKFQAEIERQWERKDANKYWITSAGGSILYSPDQPEEEVGFIWYGSNLGSKEFYRRVENTSHNKKPWFNLHVSAGHEWIIRSKNILQAKIKLTYSPSPFLKGTYEFYPGGGPDQSGSYKTSGSWISIGGLYLFKLKKKNI